MKRVIVSVKSPTSDKRWFDNLFISGGNPHLTSRFCGVMLGSTTISKIVSEPPPKSVRTLAIRFSLSGHPPFMSTLQMFNSWHEGVC
jgi:hypothetical protein